MYTNLSFFYPSSYAMRAYATNLFFFWCVCMYVWCFVCLKNRKKGTRGYDETFLYSESKDAVLKLDISILYILIDFHEFNCDD